MPRIATHKIDTNEVDDLLDGLPKVAQPQEQKRPSLAPSVPLPPPPTPASVPAAARERYRCTVSYPASSEYELDLKHGDVVVSGALTLIFHGPHSASLGKRYLS